MKILEFIKNLIFGFWKNGFISLCRVVFEHWIISLFVIIIITKLCSDSKTAIYAWFLIAIFAIYCAVKAIIGILVEIINYTKTNDVEDKNLIIQKIGGKIFDFILCIVGIFQSLRVFSHISKITKSSSSAVNVVDDIASGISNFLKDLHK